MRTLLIQPGARHGYALARFLQQAAALQRLYTDFAIAEGTLEHALLKAFTGTRRGQSLSRRVVYGIPRSAVRGLAARALYGKIRAPGASERWSFLPRDLREADVIYSQYFAGGPQFEELTAHGARFVSDVFIMPSAHRVINAEAAKFPDWREAIYSPAEAATLDAISMAMITRSDALFCPSQSVIDDVASYMPSARGKCRLIRYGSSLTFTTPNEPVTKRILFAGSVQLRKGPQYLAMAAAKIARIDPSVSFVFAGGVSAAAAAQLRAPNIELLGHVSRERMRKEFLCADLLAFPSLAEGSAGVVLEAMSAGVPIVATRQAGVDFRDGESGLMVPAGDPDALADAILRIVGNRAKRNAMAHSARAEFAAYDEKAWASSFVGNLRAISPNG